MGRLSPEVKQLRAQALHSALHAHFSPSATTTNMEAGTHATGLAWALLSCVLFGSFGVPIKTPAVVNAKVDPVVFQCYKTLACFSTCWIALLYVPFKFTYWGFVGAAIWVVNGTCAIAAVQKAGLAVAQSLWSGLSIIVAFLWGVYAFGEVPKSTSLAWCAIALMTAGMVAIGYGAANKGGTPCKPHTDGDVDSEGAHVEAENLIRDEDGAYFDLAPSCFLVYSVSASPCSHMRHASFDNETLPPTPHTRYTLCQGCRQATSNMHPKLQTSSLSRAWLWPRTLVLPTAHSPCR